MSSLRHPWGNIGSNGENAENAKKADKLAEAAKSNADNGNHLMQDMLKAIEDISVSSKNINKILKAIDDIAFQTNILSLNAAVEAPEPKLR